MTTFGLFDSGIGGLSVLSAMLDRQPDLHALYLADSAWVPYGDKPAEALTHRIQDIVRWMTPQIDYLVVACNTSAALLNHTWPTPLPVIDPIQATAQAFAAYNHSSRPIRKLAVLATENTVNSLAYPTAIKALRPDITVVQCACPGLANAVETQAVIHLLPQLKDWLNQLCQNEAPDSIILGCTHYPFATESIQQVLNTMGMGHIPLFDPANAITDQLNGKTEDKKPPSSALLPPKLTMLTTGKPDLLKRQLTGLKVHSQIKTANFQHIHYLFG